MNKKINGTTFAPFNIISMKDIKDKKTQKPGLRPLFDCVDSLQSAVEDIRTYLESEPGNEETELVQSFLKKLTDMQVQILEITKSRLQGQNLSPLSVEEQSMLKHNPAEEEVTVEPIIEQE
jgi:hypothetical protein